MYYFVILAVPLLAKAITNTFPQWDCDEYSGSDNQLFPISFCNQPKIQTRRELQQDLDEVIEEFTNEIELWDTNTNGTEIPLCQNGGRPILIAETKPFCTQNCTKLLYGCLCPGDYRGQQCEILNQIQCQVDLINDFKCKRSQLTQLAYDNQPPCKYIRNDTIYYQDFLVTCKNQYPNVETVHRDFRFHIIWSNASTNLINNISQKIGKQYFQYAIDTPTLKSQYDFSIRTSLQFLNWIELFNQSQKPIQGSNLTKKQIFGEQSTLIEVNFTDYTQYSLYGRYTFQILLELKMDVKGQQVIYNPIKNVKLGYFENLSMEPKKVENDQTFQNLLIAFAVFSLVLLLCLIKNSKKIYASICLRPKEVETRRLQHHTQDELNDTI